DDRAFNNILGSFTATGRFLIRTPNAHYIPFVRDPDVNVRIWMRKDCRFGPDDMVFCPTYASLRHAPHYACIPQCPLNLEHPTAIMWSDPSTWMQSITDRCCPAKPMFLLSEEVDKHLQPILRSAHRRVTAYLDRCARTGARPLSWARGLDCAVTHAVARLRCVATDLDHQHIVARELQRYWLELMGVINYVDHVEPVLLGHSPPPTNKKTPHWFLGAVVLSVDDLQKWYDAGVPVWFVSPWDMFATTLHHKLPETCRGLPYIRAMRRMRTPSEMAEVEDHALKLPYIYTGLPYDLRRIAQIHRYSTIELTFNAPFDTPHDEHDLRDPLAFAPPKEVNSRSKP
ncbi:hypothetical protein GGF50DRAFT_37746, partial [Schizophyllum commune]